MADKPCITLELQDERCTMSCMADAIPGVVRPRLVKVSLNRAARDLMAMRTGRAPSDQIVCTNASCGGLMKALNALSPLQDLVK